MKTKLVFLISLLPFLVIGCKKDGSLATVVTYIPKYVASSSATIGAHITADGGSGVADCGVFMSFSANAETSGVKLQMGNDTGLYLGRVTGLTPDTKYYIKAYALNDKGQALGEEVTITTGLAVQDYDNNTYETVVIGSQTWMAKNLATTHYLNGDPVLTTTPSGLDISAEGTPKYMWSYAGDDNNAVAYGKLYTWYSVTDTRKLCPTGWHIPTDAEWTTLETTLGGYFVAGSRLKEMGNSHWQAPYNTDAVNESCFTALPGGYRDVTGTFYLLKNEGNWWSATESEATKSYSRTMTTGSSSVTRTGALKGRGLTVRCIKD
jgi:uncharacterized protein (TIGR02145 family)